MTVEKNGIIPRILRDMNDGVLVVDMHGKIIFLNDRGCNMLGVDENVSGKNYGRVFLEDRDNGSNDGVHQFVLDAVYDKEHTHTGEAVYQAENQELKSFRLTSSFLYGEDGEKKIGIVVVFSDVTEVAKLNRQRREASAVFSVLMICVCAYLFLCRLLCYLNVEPPGQVMSLVIEGISIIMFFIILKTTSFSIRDIGLKITNAKETFVPDIAITLAAGILLVVGKVIILRIAPGFFPEGAPFWDWSVGTFADVIYPFTVVLQEFLARGVMQENLNRIFTGKYAGLLSIVVSALVFGVLHIAYGFPYMLAASLLLGILGIFYHKQGNIWGLCIIHYVLGEIATFLRYLI